MHMINLELCSYQTTARAKFLGPSLPFRPAGQNSSHFKPAPGPRPALLARTWSYKQQLCSPRFRPEPRFLPSISNSEPQCAIFRVLAHHSRGGPQRGPQLGVKPSRSQSPPGNHSTQLNPAGRLGTSTPRNQVLGTCLLSVCLLFPAWRNTISRAY